MDGGEPGGGGGDDDDDTICAVCFEGWTEPANQILFCEKCDIAVHQGCYGVSAVPEGDWLCAPCERGLQPTQQKCVLCPFMGGALRPVGEHGDYIHVCCVIWLPEIGYSDPETMRRVQNLNKINPQRLSLRCSICGAKHGACVQCSVKECCNAMHVVCAHRHGLLRMETSPSDDVQMTQYCRKHAPPLPPEFSFTPEAERARAFGVMKHVMQLPPEEAGTLAELTPEDISKNLNRLHHQYEHRRQQPAKRRRNDGSGRKKSSAASSRKRTLASYASEELGGVSSRSEAAVSSTAFGGHRQPEAGGSSNSGRTPRDGHDMDTWDDASLDDFRASAQGDAAAGCGQGFWSHVESYFAPLDLGRAAQMLFGQNRPPASAIHSYLDRIRRGQRAVTAPALGSAPDDNLHLCAATLSATLDLPGLSGYQIEAGRAKLCSVCLQVLGGDDQHGLCASCTEERLITLVLHVNEQTTECTFQLSPCTRSEIPESTRDTTTKSGNIAPQTQQSSATLAAASNAGASIESCVGFAGIQLKGARVSVPSRYEPSVRSDNASASAGALRTLVNFCLGIDRRSLERVPNQSASTSPTEPVAGGDVARLLAIETAEAVQAMQERTAHCAQLVSLLREFSWDGRNYARKLDMWDLTKLTNRLAKFADTIGALPESPSAAGCHSGGNDDTSLFTMRLQSFRVLSKTEGDNPADSSLTEIERDAANLSIELAERCRENAASSFSLWERIKDAKENVGSGASAAILGGARADSVADAQSISTMQELVAQTNETYHTRMNWHQLRVSELYLCCSATVLFPATSLILHWFCCRALYSAAHRTSI